MGITRSGLDTAKGADTWVTDEEYATAPALT